MLRRYDPAKEAVAQALRELTLEHQRIADEEQRQLKTTIQEHLTAATDLLERRQIWPPRGDGRATRFSSTRRIRQSIALEKRIRQLLDEQVARDQARELELALRTQAEQARQAARSAALAQARSAIESSLAAEDVEKAEKALKAADESIEPGPSSPIFERAWPSCAAPSGPARTSGPTR